MMTCFSATRLTDVGFGLVRRCRSALDLSNANSLAPPCLGPRSAPMPPVIAEYMSEPVPAIDARGEGRRVELVLGVEVQRRVHRPHPQRRDGLRPCSRCRKWPPIESSSVSTSMRLPEWREVVPVEQHRPEATPSAGRRCRARSASLCSGPSGSDGSPAPRQPVRITSIGCVLAGSSSSAPCTPAGMPRSALQLALVAGELAHGSAACRAPAGRRPPRIRTARRCRGCRSRGSAGRCRCGRRCTARCCRRPRRTARPISSALGDDDRWQRPAAAMAGASFFASSFPRCAKSCVELLSRRRGSR